MSMRVERTGCRVQLPESSRLRKTPETAAALCRPWVRVFWVQEGVWGSGGFLVRVEGEGFSFQSRLVHRTRRKPPRLCVDLRFGCFGFRRVFWVQKFVH